MDKIVLLCCVGRSGSTTLQRILNTIPNSNICGENQGAVLDLLRFYRNIKHTSFSHIKYNGKTPLSFDELIKLGHKPAWYNSYDYEEIVRLIKFMIVKLFKKDSETTLWGFKEIRYGDGNLDLIREFKELFPQTKVILNIRENIKQQSQSAWFKEDKNSIHLIKKYNTEMLDFYAKNKEYVHFMTFEKMFSYTHIKEMFNFIDCCEYFNADEIRNILSNKLEG